MTRYIVVGAGAVGASIGGMLHRLGRDVVFVARGAHGEALQRDGLRLLTPKSSLQLNVPTILGPAAGALPEGTEAIVLLAVKSQDTAAAIHGLPKDTPIVCAQNGVTNEALVAERFERVYGMMVWMPCLHLEPGTVELYAAEPGGMLRLGLHPHGVDELTEAVAADLTAAGFDAAAVPDISAWKHAKLITNSGNAMDAFVDGRESHRPIFDALLAEGAAVLTAAGISFKPPQQLIDEMVALTNWSNRKIAGASRPGGSTWQSATRGAPVESIHFNGFLVELGARHGVPTPLNRALLEIARQCPPPRSVPLDRLREVAEIRTSGDA